MKIMKFSFWNTKKRTSHNMSIKWKLNILTNIKLPTIFFCLYEKMYSLCIEKNNSKHNIEKYQHTGIANIIRNWLYISVNLLTSVLKVTAIRFFWYESFFSLFFVKIVFSAMHTLIHIYWFLMDPIIRTWSNLYRTIHYVHVQ